MGKRKSETFTVCESVSNWSETRPHSPSTPDGSAEIASRTGLVNEALVQANGPAESINDPGLTARPTGLDNGEPAADAASPGVTEEETEGPWSAEVDDPLWAAHEAFWALLQAAGYEIW